MASKKTATAQKAARPAVTVKKGATATKKPVASPAKADARTAGAKVPASLTVKSPTQKAKAAASRVATRKK